MRKEIGKDEQIIAADRYTAEREYWLGKLSGTLQQSRVPYDRSQRAGEIVFEVFEHRYAAEIFPLLLEQSSGSDPKIHVILTAVVAVLLEKYTGNKDIILCTPIYNPGLEGNFVNTLLPLRIRLEDDITFREVLKQVSRTILEATENQNYPMEILFAQLNQPLTGPAALPDVALVLENIHRKEHLYPLTPALLFSFQRTGDALLSRVDYRADLYEPGTVRAVVEDLETLLHQAVMQRESKLSSLQISGREQRRQPRPEEDRTGIESLEENKTSAKPLVAPRNAKEKKMRQIWAEILEIDETAISIDDYFLQLDANSLKAIMLTSMIHKEFDTSIPLEKIFELGTIRGLVGYIEGAQENPYISIEPVEKKEYYPLSSAQRRLYFIQQMDLKSTGYNMPFLFSIGKEVEKEKIASILKSLIARHESLRTSFVLIDEVPVQRVYDDVEFELEFFLIPETKGQHEEGAISGEFVRPFDLTRPPLMRSGLICHPGGHYTWMVDIHHIISDGTSNTILKDDFLSLYNDRALKPLRLHYKDFSQWQNRIFADRAIESQETYWLSLYQDARSLPRLNLPLDYKQPSTFTFAGDYYKFAMEKEEAEKFKALGSRHSGTLYMNIMAALNTLFYKYTGQTDIIIGSGIAGRRHADLLFIIGMFVNTLALRNYPHGDKDYDLFLKEVIDHSVNAFENQDFQFETLVDMLDLERDPSRNPLFDVLMLVQNYRQVDADVLTPLADKDTLMIPRAIPGQDGINKTSKFAMTFFISEQGEEVEIAIEYYTAIFKRETIAALAHHFKKIIKEVSSNPGTRLKDIEILSVQEKQKLLCDFNDTQTVYPRHKTLVELFKEQAEAIPDQIALVSGSAEKNIYLTYKELQGRARHVAHYLYHENKVAPDERIGILMDRAPAMIVAVLSILEAGGAYVPLSPSYPEERIKNIIKDSRIRVLIGEKHYIKTLNRLRGECDDVQAFFCMDSEDVQSEKEPAASEVMIPTSWNDKAETSADEVRGENTERIQPKPKQNHQHDRRILQKYKPGEIIIHRQPHNLAYIIYTSGSTGTPKGVMVEDRSVVRLVKNTNFVDFKAGDKILQTGALEFDASTFEIWGALLNGLTLILESKNDLLAAGILKDIIKKNKITTMWMTSSFFNRMLDEDIEIFSGLRNFLVGGEALSPVHIRRLRNGCPGLNIINGYGPTENVTFSTTWLLDKDYEESIPIGRPIANSSAYVLDGNGNILPVGAAGELYVGGDGVSRGYLNDVNLTAAKFRNNPFLKNDRLYRTGDCVRWQPGGMLEFLGRYDTQVKIRGFRIELGEIENRLLKHEAITEAVVIDRVDSADGKYLSAYIVAREKIDAAEIKEMLAASLPEYMIPSFILPLEKIPLTSNGKVDRKALPLPEIMASKRYTAPTDELEEKLVNIWSEILGVPAGQIGIDINFFEIGGHSLKATILTAKIHKELNVKVPLVEVFKLSTIRELAQYIQQAREERFNALEPVEEREYYALSSAQKRLYVLQQMDKTAVNYNVPIVVSLDGELDINRLRIIFRKLIRRHESLRTSFHLSPLSLLSPLSPFPADEPVQIIHTEAEFEIEYHDVGNRPQAMGESSREAVDYEEKAAVESVIKNFVRPFDLSCVPLLRVGLIKTGNNRHLLMLDMHHIVTDGISMEIVLKELMALYAGSSLPQLKVRYRDFSGWQTSKMGRDAVRKQKEYWLKEFADEMPILNLRTDYPRPPVQGFQGSSLNFHFNTGETKKLKSLAMSEDATLFMTLLSVFTLLLGKLSGQEDICIGTPIAAREHADLRHIAGMFVNTLVLRNFPQSDKTFREFLHEVKERTLNAFENQAYPFEELVDMAVVTRDAGRNPLFDVMFEMQNYDVVSGNIPAVAIPGLKLMPYPQEDSIAKFDLSLRCAEIKGELFFILVYCTGLFKQETIEKFVRYFEEIVRQIHERPGRRLKDIDIIPGAEKKHVLFNFNNTTAAFPGDKTLHGLFSEQAQAAPDRVALVGCPATNKALNKNYHRTHISYTAHISYKVLNEQSQGLAYSLIEKGVMPDNIVALMVERSIEMMVGILGILKAGGAYMPIDPGSPRERVDYMLKDSCADAIITAETLSSLETFSHRSYTSYSSGLSPRSLRLAYIIYTSGSTGRPKGVMIEHRSVVNRLNWMQRAYPLGEKDVLLQKTPYVFDVSVWELFWWSWRGASLCLLEANGERNPKTVIDTIERHNITVIHFVPSMFHAFMQYLESSREVGKLGTLRYLFSSGEALGVHHVETFDRLISGQRGIKLINLYGPTEATVDVSYFNVPREKSRETLFTIPIGKPIDNIRLYILDKDMHLQPVGLAGELYIAGVGLARGYLNQPALTAEKFQENPYLPGEKLYRSGDLVTLSENGEIEYLGRLDHQVKIRGFRIDPGEIENCLCAREEISEAAVLAKQDQNGDKYLCAYFILKASTWPGTPLEDYSARFKAYLAQILPDYMIPAFFVRLDNMPLTPNGKLDTKALPAPGADVSDTYNPPRNAVEKILIKIWRDILPAETASLESIGIDDNFFALGGNSLKAIFMLARVHKELNVKLSLNEIFKDPTIRGLALHMPGKMKNQYSSIEPAEERAYYPLSSAQKRLYILYRIEIGGMNYNRPLIVTLEGEIDNSRLEIAFKKLIMRHESLRTSFELVAGEPLQKVHKEKEVKFNLEYYEAGPSGADEIIRRFMKPFDLAVAPIFRAGLVKTGNNMYVLMVEMHHIISDGISNDILLKDFKTFYRGEALNNLRIRYKDYSQWQNNMLSSGEIKQQERYWLDRFNHPIPRLNLPVDFSRQAALDFRGDEVEFKIEKELAGKIKELVSATGATLFMVLLAAYGILLSKYSGQEDIIVGAGIAGRPHADLENIIGMFVNMLAIRMYPVHNRAFRGFLEIVKKDTLDAYDNQEYQFDELVLKLNLERELGRNPLFDAQFTFQNMDEWTGEKIDTSIPGIDVKAYRCENKGARFDLSFTGIEDTDSITLLLLYKTAIFQRSTIEKMAAHYVEILTSVVEDTQTRLEDIKLSHGYAAGKSYLSKGESLAFGF